MSDAVVRLPLERANDISKLAIVFAAKGYVVLLAQLESLKPLEINNAMQELGDVAYLHLSVDFSREEKPPYVIVIWKTDVDGFPKMIPMYSLQICLAIGSSNALPKIIVGPEVSQPHFLTAIIKETVKEAIGLAIN